jgi:hypothetical protein
MPSTLITDLDPRFQAIARTLLRRCEAIEPVKILYTLRTKEEQADAVKRGASKTLKSLHLAQPCCGKSHAIDIAPIRVLAEKNWAPKDPVWEQMRVIGRSLGLKCNIAWDKPHYEWYPAEPWSPGEPVWPPELSGGKEPIT